jgi:hypothetical protein
MLHDNRAVMVCGEVPAAVVCWDDGRCCDQLDLLMLSSVSMNTGAAQLLQQRRVLT